MVTMMTMKSKRRHFVSAGYIATVIIGAAISEVQIMEPGAAGPETIGIVKNYKTRTAIDCMRAINSMLKSPKAWRIL